MPDQHYEKILAHQLVMNRETWNVLQSHGLTESAKVRPEFSYNAPDKESAEALRALLQQQTDYDVTTESTGSQFRKSWRVEGTTKETMITPEILDQWVTWMVAAGKERGCDFGGWGTEVQPCAVYPFSAAIATQV